MGKVEVTRADREAAWHAIHESDKDGGEYERDSGAAIWIATGETPYLADHETWDVEVDVAAAIATARAEGRAEERRDAVAWLQLTGDALFDTAVQPCRKAIESGAHVGAAKAKDSP